MNHNEPLGWTPAMDAQRLAADLATLRRQALQMTESEYHDAGPDDGSDDALSTRHESVEG